MIDLFFLILAYALTFFMVGFVFIEVFFGKILFRIKFPLYIISSLVLSTFLVYFTAIIFGLNRDTTVLTLIWFLPISAFLLIKKRSNFINYLKNHFLGVALSAVVALIYFTALNPAILGVKDDYLVMSGPNWQDTALHLSITQSLTQGNFPPQAPYFSGAPLGYYYFSDLHSAIIAVFYNQFFPRVFVYDNALLAGVLALVIYSLAFEVTKNKRLSLVSSFIGSFFGSFMFINFFKEIFSGEKIAEILSQKSFSMEYNQVFGMANMADYYLQNRPMMIGLPVVVVVILLGVYGFKKEKINLIFLAGILCASLIKFQFFCVLAGAVSVFIISLSTIKSCKYKFLFKSWLSFSIPILISYLLFGTKSVNGLSFWVLVKDTFHFGVWDRSKTLSWHLEFLILNLGIPLIITILGLLFNTKNKNKFIPVLALTFVAMPYLMSFTIAEGDMLKFFYFTAILISILTPFYLNSVIKNKFIYWIVILIIIFTTTFSSFLTLSHSFLNKNSGYSKASYNAGQWIRKFTYKNSVFVTMPTVHSAPTDFGGRLRVISYINWPYTHGFNTGEDNVFARVTDVQHVFETGDTHDIKLKYGAKYIYYGEEEKSEFPKAKDLFENNKNLNKIYNSGDILIYEIL